MLSTYCFLMVKSFQWTTGPPHSTIWWSERSFGRLGIQEHSNFESWLPVLSLSGVDHHNCFSPGFSVLCEHWFELVLFHIAPHSVHPPQSGPSSGSRPSYLHHCYFLCNIIVVSSHYMAIPRKAFLGDIRGGDCLDHCIALELLISDYWF